MNKIKIVSIFLAGGASGVLATFLFVPPRFLITKSLKAELVDDATKKVVDALSEEMKHVR